MLLTELVHCWGIGDFLQSERLKSAFMKALACACDTRILECCRYNPPSGSETETLLADVVEALRLAYVEYPNPSDDRCKDELFDLAYAIRLSLVLDNGFMDFFAKVPEFSTRFQRASGDDELCFRQLRFHTTCHNCQLEMEMDENNGGDCDEKPIATERPFYYLPYTIQPSVRKIRMRCKECVSHSGITRVPKEN